MGLLPGEFVLILSHYDAEGVMSYDEGRMKFMLLFKPYLYVVIMSLECVKCSRSKVF